MKNLTELSDQLTEVSASRLAATAAAASAGSKNGAPVGQIVAEIMEITPEMAKDWLENNNDNNFRGITKSLIVQLMDDIAKDRWAITSSAISFDVNDQLVNGQHRLTAIAESGVTCKCLVMLGMPDGSRESPAEDSGRSRTTAEHVKARLGLKNGSMLGGTVRRLAALAKYHSLARTHNAYRLSDSAIIEILENIPSINEAVQDAAFKMKPVAVPAVLGVFTWIANHENPKLCRECLDILHGHSECSTTHPFNKLREICLKARSDQTKKGVGFRDQDMLLYLLGAWEKAKAGKKVSRLNRAKQIMITDDAAKELEVLISL